MSHVWVLAENGVDGTAHLLLDTGLKPVHPLVDLGAFDGVATEERSVAMGEELGNGVAFRQVALGSLQERELVRWVECFVSRGISDLISVNNKLDVLVGKLGSDLAHLDEDVAWELCVQFLNRKRK